MSFESEHVAGKYSRDSKFWREEMNRLVLKSDMTLAIADEEHRLSALQIIGGIVISKTNWSRDHIFVEILLSNDNGVMKPTRE